MNINNPETILYWVATWYKSVYSKNPTKLHNNWLNYTKLFQQEKHVLVACYQYWTACTGLQLSGVWYNVEPFLKSLELKFSCDILRKTTPPQITQVSHEWGVCGFCLPMLRSVPVLPFTKNSVWFSALQASWFTY